MAQQVIVAFTCPGNAPSTNRSYKIAVVGKGRRAHAIMFKSAECKRWQAALAEAAKVALDGRPMLAGELAVTLSFYHDSRRPDLDGPIKPTLDALQKVIYLNDRAITTLVVTKHLDKSNPRVEVIVEGADGRE